MGSIGLGLDQESAAKLIVFVKDFRSSSDNMMREENYLLALFRSASCASGIQSGWYSHLSTILARVCSVLLANRFRTPFGHSLAGAIERPPQAGVTNHFLSHIDKTTDLVGRISSP